MANKNYVGTMVHKAMKTIDYINNQIDNREKTGVRHLDEAEERALNYTVNDEGRCWSF